MKKESRTIEYAKKPKNGYKFYVDPESLDQEKIFSIKCKVWDEKIKNTIRLAFLVAQKERYKYYRPFYTYIPEVSWIKEKYGYIDYTPSEIRELGAKIGDHCADWIEQCFEWAQRIQNGEDWVSLCGEPDVSTLCRLVHLDEDLYWNVGGNNTTGHGFIPSADIIVSNYQSKVIYNNMVPLVVGYEGTTKLAVE